MSSNTAFTRNTFAAPVRGVLNYDGLAMHILVTNDDGILSDGLWTLVRELKNIGRITVAAPSSEQSAIGTSVTLRQVLRVQRVKPLVPDVEAFSIDGTPSDSVILTLGKLVNEKVDLVVSGINLGLNLGEDVHISGTVAAALQGYLSGFPALAVSTVHNNHYSLEVTARVTALTAQKIHAYSPPSGIFLNLNIPNLPPQAKVKGVKITHLARESHINTIDEGDDGRRKYYWLVRRELDESEKKQDSKTDIGAIKRDSISITPLYTDWIRRPPLRLLDKLRTELIQELKTEGLCS